MVFGTTITTYNQKPNKNLLNYSSASTKPLKIQNLSSAKPISPMTSSTMTRPNPTKTAVGGGSNIPMPAMRNQFLSPVFQPTYSGNQREGVAEDEGAYGWLGQINAGTDIANQGAEFKMNLANTIIRKRNQAARESALYNQGYEQGGGGQSFDSGFNQPNQTSGQAFYSGSGRTSGLSEEQIGNARAIANIGRARGLNDNAIQIAIMTALAESEMRNITWGDRDSLGMFQQRPSQGWGTPQQVTNINYSINKFYDALQGTNWQRMNPWNAAQAVQRSFDPSGNNYRARYATAMAVYRDIQGQPVGSMLNYASSSRPNSAAGFIQAYNNKYIDYDGAYGNQCVDLYNYYTAKFVGGKNIMVGWAPELYNAYDTRAYHRTGANVPGGMGYVAIFRPGGSTPSGHVAIVVGDNGNGTLRVLHSNAGPMGSRGNTMISNISKSTLMGYLIPRKLMRSA